MSRPATLLGSLALAAYLATWLVWRSSARAPLAWSALAWAAVSLAFFFLSRGARRGAFANATALLAAVALVEGLLWAGQPRDPFVVAPGVTFEGSYTRPNYLFLMPEPALGYRPRPGVSARAVKKYKGAPVYDVTYNVGENGLRVGPPARADGEGCALFFGDSFAWGEAVRDDETAAYQLGLLSGYSVYNFAFTGYGAHQMLAQLESGVVRREAACPKGGPVLAVYQALPNNVGRVAGLTSWDKYGPRYVLTPEGRVERRERFDQGDSILNDRAYVKRSARRWLARAKLYERTLGRERPVNDFDLERYAAVVEASARELAREFAGATFVAVVWDDLDERRLGPGSKARAVLDRLARRGLDARPVGDILPDYERDYAKYHLANDAHPTPDAHRRIASYFYREFVELAHNSNH